MGFELELGSQGTFKFDRRTRPSCTKGERLLLQE